MLFQHLGSIAVITMPALTGIMSDNIISIIWLEIALAIIGAVAAIVVMYRYNQLTGKKVRKETTKEEKQRKTTKIICF